MGTSKSGVYLSKEGSKTKVSQFALIHSSDGTFMNVGSNNRKAKFRLHSGGHGEQSLRLLNKYGIKYKITKTFPNGVREGFIYNHKDKSKSEKSKYPGQTWFPKDWSRATIKKAGEHVASLKKNRHHKDGQTMYGTWKGVIVGVIRTNGKIATIFPYYNQFSKNPR